jgi:hypothetical protein
MRPSCCWKVNIKIDLKEIGYEYMNWIRLTQNGVQWWDIVVVDMNLLVIHQGILTG